MGELIFLGLLAAVCIYFYTLTFGFKVSILDKSGGAGVFPRIVIIFLLVFLIIRIIMICFDKDKKPFVFFELFKGMRLFFFLALIGYIACFRFLGYICSTILFLAVTINVFTYKANDSFGSTKAIVIRNVALVAFAVGMYFFFASALKIMLPVGFWPTLFA